MPAPDGRAPDAVAGQQVTGPPGLAGGLGDRLTALVRMLTGPGRNVPATESQMGNTPNRLRDDAVGLVKHVRLSPLAYYSPTASPRVPGALTRCL